MALCSSCNNITFDADGSCELSNAVRLAESAEEGCPDCIFFLQATEKFWDQKFEEISFIQEDVNVSLQRSQEVASDVGLRFADDEGYWEVPLRLCSPFGHEPAVFAECEESEGKFLGRLIAPKSGDAECQDLAISWMEKCSKHHASCVPLNQENALPTRIIHVPRDSKEPLKLQVTEGRTGRYVALSYCWGDGMSYQTTSKCYDDRLNGFDAGLLPKTIHDAVIMTRNLGFDYIWIDSLCIIQNDGEDWARQSSRMSQVYGNASLTLAADLAGSADFGIFQPRNTAWSHKFGPGEEYQLQSRASFGHDCIGWERVPFENLGQRGWALQERILSTRILHFFEEQLAWECNTTIYMEDTRGRHTKQTVHFAISTFNKFVRKPLISNRKTLTDIQNLSVELDQEPDGLSRQRCWQDMVQESSIRHLTMRTDRLPSLSGLASAIEMPCLGNYLAGVWEAYAFIGLTWYPLYSQQLQPTRTYCAPSWSWAASEGQFMKYGGVSECKPSILEYNEWHEWSLQYGPSLGTHGLKPKDPSNPKGEVEPGSHIVVSGYCRDIYIAEQPNTIFDAWEWQYVNTTRGEDKTARKVHMDIREEDRDSTCYFWEDLRSKKPEVDLATLEKCICLQISREQGLSYPKVYALILQRADGTEDSYERIGLLGINASETADFRVSDWERRTLKLH